MIRRDDVRTQAGMAGRAYRFLVWWRLRSYLRTSGDLVLRHWQWLALACLVVPGTPVVSIFRPLALLLALSVSPDLSSAQRWATMLGIDVAAILWILPQRHSLSGGPFASYARTLPLPRSVRLGVDATLLAVADAFVVVSAGIAIASLYEPYALCSLLALIVGMTIAQAAILADLFLALFGVVLGDGALVAGLALSPSGTRWLLPFAAIGSAGLGLLGAERLARRRRPQRIARDPVRTNAGARLLSRRAPILLVQSKAIAECPLPTLVQIGAAVALAAGAGRLVAVFQFDARALPTTILAMAAISLLLSGFYRTLGESRGAMAGYMAALPLPGRFWPVRDTQFVLLLNCVPLGVLLVPQIVRGLVPILGLAGLAATNQGLLALLRWPVVHGGRRSLIYGVLLAALWSGAAIAAVSR